MPLNRKAQIFTWDIILATVIFLVVLGTIIFLWTDTLGDIDATDTQYEIGWLATALSEQMARTPGSPANWTDTPIENITVIGLASTRTIGNDTGTLDRILDPDKVVTLIALSQNNYSSLRNKLFGTGKYDYYMELSCLDPTVMDCFEGLKFTNPVNQNRNITCVASNTTLYISNYTLRTDPDLAAVWRFDEVVGNTAADNSANGNDATIHGANRTTGKYKSGLQFNGVDSYVQLPEPPATSTNLVNGTVLAWIKTSNAGSSYRGIVVKQYAYGMFLIDNSFVIYDWDKATPSNSNTLLNDNQWHQVGFTFQNGTVNGAILYIDGNKSLTTNLTISNQGEGIIIGAGNNPATLQYFNGSIDDVKIWSRALSDAEISQEYARGSKYCRFGLNTSIENAAYQLYDTKTINFRHTGDEALFDDETTFMESTAKLKVVIYEKE
jgi:hypothetical protein